MSIYKKLQEVRCALQRAPLKKSGRNDFAKYNYFELGDFLPAINDLFNERGLCGCVSFTADLATLRVIDVDDGSVIEFTSPMGKAELKGTHEVQQIGAVETYQRRYLYITALEIVEHDALEPATCDPRQKATDNLESIAGAATVEALKAIFGGAYSSADQPTKARYKKAYDKRKSELDPTPQQEHA